VGTYITVSQVDRRCSFGFQMRRALGICAELSCPTKVGGDMYITGTRDRYPQRIWLRLDMRLKHTCPAQCQLCCRPLRIVGVSDSGPGVKLTLPYNQEQSKLGSSKCYPRHTSGSPRSVVRSLTLLIPSRSFLTFDLVYETRWMGFESE
jgi:hypothetical protein